MKARTRATIILICLTTLYPRLITCDGKDQLIEQAEFRPSLEDDIDMAMAEENKYENEMDPEGGGPEVPGVNLSGPASEGDPGMNTLDSEVGTENLGGEEQFINNKEALEAQTPEENDAAQYLMEIEENSEIERMKNFKQIADDLKILEEEYKERLKKIPAVRWNEKSITEIVGQDFTKIVNDVSKAFFISDWGLFFVGELRKLRLKKNLSKNMKI